MRLVVFFLVLSFSVSSLAEDCSVRNASVYEMAEALAVDLGQLQRTEQTRSGLAGIYETGIICFFERRDGAAEGIFINTDRAKVGIADCYDADNSEYSSYDFDLVDGWFSSCSLTKRGQKFGIHTTIGVD